MTVREGIAYSVGRDDAHREARPTMTVAERAGYPSQRAMSEALGDRLRRARVERFLVETFGTVGACARENTAQGRGPR